MKAGSRIILLRILATAAVNACLYAAAVTLRELLFGGDGGLLSLALLVAAIILAHAAVAVFVRNAPAFIRRLASKGPVKLLAFMLKINEVAEFISLAIAWLVMLAPLAFTYFTYSRESVLRALFEIVPVMLAYIISLKHARLPASKIMTKSAVYTGFGILFVCLELPLLFEGLLYLRSRLFAISLFFIFAYLIVKNQEDIESNIFSKKHVEKSILPRNLRSFNALNVSVIFLIILLLFNFKRLVIAIINLSAKLATLIVGWVLLIMEWLAPEEEFFLQEAMSGSSELPDLAGQPGSAVANFIFNVLSRFAVLYLAYRLLVFIIRRLPTFCRRVAQLIKRLFSIQKEQGPIEESDFVDETETVKPIREGISKRDSRKVRRGRSDLKRIKDPVLRIRMMYLIILNMLPSIGVSPEKSDTTMEIIKKTSCDDVLEELYPFTQVYNQVRYGEERPDNTALEDAQKRFDKTLELIGRK